MKVTGDVDDRLMRKKMRELGPRKVVAASSRGINRALTGVRAELSRRVRGEVSLKASVVRDSLKMHRAPRNRAEAEIVVAAKPISLKEFAARQVRKGVAVRVKKKSGRKVVAGAFIVDKLGGHVFRRDGKPRLPIRKLFGPNIASQAEQLLPEMGDAVKAIVGKRVRESLDYEIAKADKLRQ